MEDVDMDFGAPPLATMSEHGGSDRETLDQRYADNLLALMSDEHPARAAVEAFQSACAYEVQNIRDRSSAMLHRATRYFSLRQLADVLELQASTWLLIRQLYCTSDQPAGLAGAYPRLPDSDSRKTYRHLARDAVTQDRNLQRCAHVVAWLEQLAALHLPAGLGSQFYRTDGLWQQSLLGRRGGSSGAGDGRAGGGVELDPDTVTRGSRLATDDRLRQEKLAAQLWCLVRAGQLRHARTLCRQVGASWRAVSLGGAGEWGPLPVGAAAEELDQQLEAGDVLGQLQWEVEEGVGSARQRWRWACYQAAKLGAEEGAEGSRYEAALYGALSSYVAAMLPVCSCWEDEVWCYCRAWLDLAADQAVAAALRQQRQLEVQGMADAGEEEGEGELWDGERQDWRLPGGGSELDKENMVSPDLLRDCLVKLNGNYSQHTQVSVLLEGCSLDNSWPLPGLWTQVPRSFQELAARLNSSGTAAVREAADVPEHLLQLDLIAEQWEPLILGLTTVGGRAVEQLEAGGPGGSSLDQGDDMQEGGGGAAADTSSGAAWAALRHAAHVGLMLRALGLLREPDMLGMEGDAEQRRQLVRYQRHVSRLVYSYASQLIVHATAGSCQQLHWVPLYLVHLPLDLREDLLQQLLSAAADELGDMECLRLTQGLLSWLGRWWGRQGKLTQLLQAEGVPGLGDVLTVLDQEGGQVTPLGNYLYGDLREEECRLLLHTLLQRARTSSLSSPTQRLQLLRFLLYPYLLQLDAMMAAGHQGGKDSRPLPPEALQLAAAAAASRAESGGLDVAPEVAALAVAAGLLVCEGSWEDGLLQALGLVGELAWSSGPLADALELLFDTLPESFPAAAAAAVDVAAAAGAVDADEDVGDAAAVSPVALQSQLAASLQVWQAYAALSRRYRGWKAAADALLSSSDPQGPGSQELVQQGAALGVDLLELLQEEQQQVAGGGLWEAVAAVGPDSDPEVLQQLLQEVEACSSMRLVLTVAHGVPEEGQEAADEPYPALTEQEAARLQQQLTSVLESGGGTPGVTVSLELGHPVTQVILDRQPPELQDVANCAVFADMAIEQQLPSAADLAAAPGEALRSLRTAATAVQRMCQTAALLLSCGRLQKVGGPGAAARAPRVGCISLVGSLGCSLQVSRHRLLGKVLLRTGKVVLRLAQLDPSSHMDLLGQLVNLTADPCIDGSSSSSGSQMGGGLLRALSAPEVRALLQMVQAVLEVAPLEG